MRSHKLAVGFGVLLAAGRSAPAHAEPVAAYPLACTSVPAAKVDEAYAFYKAGRALYDEGNHDAALAQFREAYKRDCSKHDLLVIISRSYEQKGERAEAAHALEVFLERVKDSPDAATYRTKIDNLKKPLPGPRPPPVVVREHTIAPWIVVGVGGAAIVTGAIVMLAAPKLPLGCASGMSTCKLVDVNGIDRPNTLGKDNPELVKNRETAGLAVGMPIGGLITLLAGVGVAAGGLVWHFLEPTGPVAASGAIKPTLTPAVAPGYAGMSLGATF